MGRSRTQKYGEPKWTDVYLLSHVVSISVRYTRRDGYDGKSSIGKVSNAQKNGHASHNAAWSGTYFVCCRGLRHFHTGLTMASACTMQDRCASTSRTAPTSTAEQKQTQNNRNKTTPNHTYNNITTPTPASVTTSNWSGRRNPGTNEFHIPGYNQIQNLNIKKSIRVARGSL